jgi:hypothetical protein
LVVFAIFVAHLLAQRAMGALARRYMVVHPATRRGWRGDPNSFSAWRAPRADGRSHKTGASGFANHPAPG